MPEEFVLHWEGDQVYELYTAGAAVAIDELTAEAAQLAEAEAPRDTGHLAMGMHNEPAKPEGDAFVGRWGADKASWHAVIVEAVHPTKAGFMRRIHDRVSGNLAERIADKVD